MISVRITHRHPHFHTFLARAGNRVPKFAYLLPPIDLLPSPQWCACRYSALKSLGEKKQCFNEYVMQRRNDEKEEERRRLKQAGVGV